tara:strand:- start:218 stop:355 length:138 start_codon:yes stop_codon:yes gene_type:complete
VKVEAEGGAVPHAAEVLPPARTGYMATIACVGDPPEAMYHESGRQ